MPRHFSSEEKEIIRDKLLDAGMYLFTKYGVGKTTIEDVTKEAGVGKGTFYLFYGSKGAFYLDLYEREWKILNEKMEELFLYKKGNLSDLLLEYIFENRRHLLEHPILSKAYDPSTVSSIFDQAGHERLREFKRLSSEKLCRIIDSWISANDLICPINTKVVAAMMRSLSFLNYHRMEIGEDILDEVVRRFADSIALMVKEATIAGSE
ncbi:TetR/AcrR family transcriptional regulator [Papillibacter cinnamivorans]|uniref:Transcriptional regulator, TetR family n=1 Tax=Papillibacter cinnamivorans DSM 12816 TaxID=1122930 RepID=A0A1W1ZLM9_9FIRM|nr:TetR/AcrR family transcriptional regulator [Papillibacter cinnamivorans]SMC48941.1 transcriptional regulator, TetR family [Papillibacter cinnamivorans DSM 12816]